MKLTQRLSYTVAAALIGFLAAGHANAASFSFTGSFAADDQVQLYQLVVGAPSTVTISTNSYGGGTNTTGQTIMSGGFEPVLSLFSPTGAFIVDNGANLQCPPGANADPSTGFCGDAYLNRSGLAAGTYTLALTQFPNVVNGANLSAGFSQAGTGNFTGGFCSVSGGSFLDEACNQRNSNYSLNIVGVDSATAGGSAVIPEPATALLVIPVALAFLLKRKRA